MCYLVLVLLQWASTVCGCSHCFLNAVFSSQRSTHSCTPEIPLSSSLIPLSLHHCFFTHGLKSHSRCCWPEAEICSTSWCSERTCPLSSPEQWTTVTVRTLSHTPPSPVHIDHLMKLHKSLVLKSQGLWAYQHFTAHFYISTL